MCGGRASGRSLFTGFMARIAAVPRSKGLGGGRSEGSCLGGQAGVLLYLCTQNTRRTAPGPPRLPWRGSAGCLLPPAFPRAGQEPADEPPGRVPALARRACRNGQVVVKKQNHRKVTASGACGSPRSRQLIPVCSPRPPRCCISLSCPRATLGPFPGTPEAADVVMGARDLAARVARVVSPCTWRGNPGAFLLLSCGLVPQGKGLPAAHAAITFKSFNQTLMARGLSGE